MQAWKEGLSPFPLCSLTSVHTGSITYPFMSPGSIRYSLSLLIYVLLRCRQASDHGGGAPPRLLYPHTYILVPLDLTSEAKLFLPRLQIKKSQAKAARAGNINGKKKALGNLAGQTNNNSYCSLLHKL